MTGTYRAIVVPRRGGPEVLEVVDRDLRPPGPDEARLRVLAAPVVQDDAAVRAGDRPFLAAPPYTPGYSLVGEVDAVGEGVTGVAPGDRVAALTTFGAHAEVAYWPAAKLAPVPAGLDPVTAAVLVLNYLVAQQVLHRVARVEAGARALVVGASGGVGTAFLDLGARAGLEMLGLASPAKHEVVARFGAVPLDYHSDDLVAAIRGRQPSGLDFVFNGMGGEYLGTSLAVLHRGGMLVHYGAPRSRAALLLLLARTLGNALLPNGKRIRLYGTHRVGIDACKEDWARLFRLLSEGAISPVVAARFPLSQARAANELLESGTVAGNLVLASPEFL